MKTTFGFSAAGAAATPNPGTRTRTLNHTTRMMLLRVRGSHRIAAELSFEREPLCALMQPDSAAEGRPRESPRSRAQAGRAWFPLRQLATPGPTSARVAGLDCATARSIGLPAGGRVGP